LRNDTCLNDRHFDTRNVKSRHPTPVKKKFWITADFRSPDTRDDPKSHESSSLDSLHRLREHVDGMALQPVAIHVFRKVRMQIFSDARSSRRETSVAFVPTSAFHLRRAKDVGTDPKRDEVRLRTQIFDLSDVRTRCCWSQMRTDIVAQRASSSSAQAFDRPPRIGFAVRSADPCTLAER
jgi:hypothetical protein